MIKLLDIFRRKVLWEEELFKTMCALYINISTGLCNLRIRALEHKYHKR